MWLTLKQSIQKNYELALPWLALLLGFLFAYAFWKNEKQSAEFDQQIRFEYKVKTAKDLIVQHVEIYEQTLYGLQSFYKASDFVTEDEFNRYVGVLFDPKKYHGLKEVSFIKYVDINLPSSYQQFIPSMDVFLHQNGHGQHQASILAPKVYVVPSQSTALYADMFIRPEVKTTMLLAAKNNTPALFSSQYQFQESQPVDVFVLQLPIYNLANTNLTGQMPQIDGWVSVEVATNDFFQVALQSILSSDLAYTVYEGQMVDGQKQIFDSQLRAKGFPHQTSLFEKHLNINVLGQDWLLAVHSLPAYDRSVDYSNADTVGFICLLASFAFAGIVHLLVARLRTLKTMQQVSHRLSISEQRWQFALEGTGDGLLDWDLESNQVMFSKRWKEMLGYQEHEISNHPDEWRHRIHPEDYVEVMKVLDASLNNQTNNYSIEFRLKCKDDSWKWVLARGMVVSRDADGKPLRMVGTQADISNIKESEEAVWQHANFDSLTGLPNRRNFYNRLDQELKKAKRSGLKVALIFLDLDKFKEVNDTQGHDQGDFLLKLTANRLNECMRGTDSVARLGGDEFVITIGDMTAAETDSLDVVAQKVLNVLSEPYYLNYEAAYISASIGIVIYPDDANNIDDLMKCVDQAMYASKQKGGRCFTYFTPHMQAVAQNRMQLSGDLRSALPRNELFIEYQPIINLKTNQVCKAEALLRWQHPIRGLVSPADFIPIAEDTRLIQTIGQWVFSKTLIQAKAWRAQFGSGFQIAVNKSPMQFNGDESIDVDWLDAMRTNELDGDAIVVEITERLLLDANEKVRSRLKLFKERGVQVALDDFGTGYSSLSYLKKFEIDYLKIDKSFVANIAEGANDLALCEAMIVMAHSLGMQVVAEGIETVQQWDLLVKAGCDFGQGYYFAKPMSADMFEQYVTHNLTT